MSRVLLGQFLSAVGVLACSLSWAVAASSDRDLARDLLRELVEINTSPAYGCTKAAEAMAARLRSAGVPDADLVLAGPRPEKQNLVVRLRGRGAARPILLIAHLDVVDAPKEGWSAGLDPFRLTERDGFFYGRGVLDVKWGVASLVANLMRLRAEGFMPDRDIIVALTADEEGGNSNGVAWLLAKSPRVDRRRLLPQPGRWRRADREGPAPPHDRADQREDQRQLSSPGKQPGRPQLPACQGQCHLPVSGGTHAARGAGLPLPLQPDHARLLRAHGGG